MLEEPAHSEASLSLQPRCHKAKDQLKQDEIASRQNERPRRAQGLAAGPVLKVPVWLTGKAYPEPNVLI